MINNRHVIVIFFILVVFSSLNSLSAASVNIESNDWSNNEISDFFNGNIVRGFNISDFDTVIFNEGTYSNISFVIKNSVNIITQGIVNFVGNSQTTAITIDNTNNVNITGINFNNYSTAIKFNNSNNSKVSNNNISASINNTTGIEYNNSKNATVENNTLKSSGSYNSYSNGIYFNNSNGDISNNEISGYGQGIVLSNSNNSNINKNEISKNTGTGISVGNSNNISIKENNITKNGRNPGSSANGDGIAISKSSNVNVSKNNISENLVYGIVYGSSHNVNIEENNINKNDYYGIYITNSTNNKINKNNITNSGGGGIWLSEQFGTNKNNTIISNNISNSANSGIYLQNTHNTLIKNNILNNNGYAGIYTSGGTNEDINITQNNIIGNVVGILLRNSANISGNEILDNSEKGIYLYGKITGSNISSNNIVRNGVGIGLYAIDEINNIDISYNRIYNNIKPMTVSGNVYNNTANLNWWGTNSPITNYNGFLIDTWYVLQLSANDYNTITNATKNFTDQNVNLSFKLTTNKPVDNDQTKLPYFEVNITLPNGTVVSGDIRNNFVNILINSTNGNFILRSIADAEDIALNINMGKTLIPDEELPEEPSDLDPTKPPKDPDSSNSNGTNNSSTINKTNAKMQNTGIPVLILLIVLISTIGISLKRRNK
ncbi:right-handed parallel beta-helix repeat-containing protein [Methanobrevibacter sp. TMH8]|uniref:right-handed parallel beta-helix repeat-containing protein n=1 Tax=Methanobrevibacter sp. TMH8 TaxID=2848611 RepID=UPI001CCD9F99|nr:right-handed parallel beta-helix repeat-containing protein [Methanobrevibacter sp. TMH8]MBZ9570152.1 right-handed parallel beta-helix repeat-containing protein [Methanobrevibacter sp. TMH8]